MSAAPSSIAFRPLLPADLDLLAGWLWTPHVARWWPGPGSAEALATKYMPRLLGEEEVALYAILVADRPVGMIQTSPAETRHAAGPDAWGIDLLIGEADLIGKGLGPRIIDRFAVTEIFDRRGAALCLADPHRDNHRSIRAFEKAGFRHRGCFEDEDQAYVLLERRSGVVGSLPA